MKADPRKRQLQLEEEMLWELLHKRDHRAITYIFNNYTAGMQNYGMQICKDTELVKDGIQDTFHDLLSKPPEKPKNRSIQGYLNITLRNKLFKKIKRMTKMINESLLEMNDLEKLHSQKNNRNDRIRREQRFLIKAAIRSLPSKQQRKAVLLRFSYKMTYKEIGERLEINDANAKKLVYRACSRLKKNFDPSDPEQALMIRKIDHLSDHTRDVKSSSCPRKKQ